MNDHDHLTALLGRLKLTALRDQRDCQDFRVRAAG